MRGIALETPRLLLRTPEKGDAGAIVRFYLENREHLARWDPRRPPEFFTEPWWRERIDADRRAVAEDRSYRFLLFVRSAKKASRDVIGMVHFSNLVRGVFQSCTLGFAIDHAHEGRGLMREALEHGIRHAFDELRLHRVEANHRPENTRSAGVLRRLGFVPQGFARDYLYIDGAWRDHVLTALVNERWAAPADLG